MRHIKNKKNKTIGSTKSSPIQKKNLNKQNDLTKSKKNIIKNIENNENNIKAKEKDENVIIKVHGKPNDASASATISSKSTSASTISTETSNTDNNDNNRNGNENKKSKKSKKNKNKKLKKVVEKVTTPAPSFQGCVTVAPPKIETYSVYINQ
eukprot:Pgem_evm1s4886